MPRDRSARPQAFSYVSENAGWSGATGPRWGRGKPLCGLSVTRQKTAITAKIPYVGQAPLGRGPAGTAGRLARGFHGGRGKAGLEGKEFARVEKLPGF